MKRYDVAIVGATGLVGRKILRVLEERNFPVDRIIPIASEKSRGMDIPFNDRAQTVVELNEAAFAHAHIVFFCAGGDVSRKWVPVAAAHAELVIDNSSEFRMDQHVPLVVPEVNPRAIFTSVSGVIANPNCSTIQMVLPLKPLHDAYRIRRIVVSTYQAVSGAGQRGLQQLSDERAHQAVEHPAFPHAIASNAIPHIALFCSDGYTREEYKMIDETRKILGDPTIMVAPTCVRVPVTNCHSESVNVEFDAPFDLPSVRKLLARAPGVILYDDPEHNVYPLASIADERDEVFVGRLRRDESVPNGLAMWIVGDNLRKGAATNAVQIAEAWIKGPEAFPGLS